MPNWSPEDDEQFSPERLEAFSRAIELMIPVYLARLFPPEFMEMYTHFETWQIMLSAARRERERIAEIGAIDGRRYNSYALEIPELIRQGAHDEAERILLACCGFEDRQRRLPVISYHLQLMGLYLKQERYAEALAIGDRYLARVDPTGGELSPQMGRYMRLLRKKLAKQERKAGRQPPPTQV